MLHWPTGSHSYGVGRHTLGIASNSKHSNLACCFTYLLHLRYNALDAGELPLRLSTVTHRMTVRQMPAARAWYRPYAKPLPTRRRFLRLLLLLQCLFSLRRHPDQSFAENFLQKILNHYYPFRKTLIPPPIAAAARCSQQPSSQQRIAR